MDMGLYVCKIFRIKTRKIRQQERDNIEMER